jgi:hypothetical protein
MQVTFIPAEEVPEEEKARHRAQFERARRNSDWLQAHWTELLPQARGKHVAVAGQEGFIGETALEAWSKAKAAHPDDDGAICQYVYPDDKVWRICACSR